MARFAFKAIPDGTAMAAAVQRHIRFLECSIGHAPGAAIVQVLLVHANLTPSANILAGLATSSFHRKRAPVMDSYPLSPHSRTFKAGKSRPHRTSSKRPKPVVPVVAANRQKHRSGVTAIVAGSHKKGN